MDDHPPVISLADFKERKHEIKEQIMKAASTMGFFYVTHTSIPEELIARVWDVNAKYFEMSDEAKAALPQLDWGTLKLLGYDLNADAGVGGSLASKLLNLMCARGLGRAWSTTSRSHRSSDPALRNMVGFLPLQRAASSARRRACCGARPTTRPAGPMRAWCPGSSEPAAHPQRLHA
jgi:hypothetical protein